MSLPVPSTQLFFAGSASGVVARVTVVPLTVTVTTAPFHTPQTAVGAMPVPKFCQSPEVLFWSLVMSVR